MGQELPVAFGAQDRRFDETANVQPARACRPSDLFQYLAMDLRIAHDSAPAHLFSSCFKLRFDERDHFTPGSEEGRHPSLPHHSREDDLERNEGYVNRDDLCHFRHAVQVADVHPFHDNDARVLPNLPRQLPVADVDGIHARRTALKQNVGEPAGRGADVRTNTPTDCNGKSVERRRQLESTPADVWQRLPQLEEDVFRHWSSGLGDHPARYLHFAGKDEGAGAFACFDQPALHEEDIETFLAHDLRIGERWAKVNAVRTDRLSIPKSLKLSYTCDSGRRVMSQPVEKDTVPNNLELRSRVRPVSATTLLLSLIREMRPRQWPKNGLLFLPLLFTLGEYWQPFSETMWRFLGVSLVAFALFCALSGLVYIVNDIVDIDRDRAHPTKRNRPLASGALPLPAAVAAGAAILAIGLPASFLLGLSFGLVAVAYLVLQFAYSLWLKNIVLIDVFAIAAGFVLRTIAGAAVLGVQISPWLFVVTTVASLFIGFGKRRQELVLLETGAANHRASLRDYSLELLDQIIAVTIASVIMSYSLYTFSAENLPKNHAMMVTIPFVLYGLFRYLYLIHLQGQGGSPEEILLRDKPTLIAAALWGLTVALILATRNWGL